MIVSVDKGISQADIAQSVVRILGKDEVTSSILVISSQQEGKRRLLFSLLIFTCRYPGNGCDEPDKTCVYRGEENGEGNRIQKLY